MSVNYLFGDDKGGQSTDNEVVVIDPAQSQSDNGQNGGIKETNNEDPAPPPEGDPITPKGEENNSNPDGGGDGGDNDPPAPEKKPGIISKKDAKPKEDKPTPDPKNEEEIRRELNLHINRTIEQRSNGAIKSLDDIDQIVAQNAELTKKLEEANNKPSRSAKFETDEQKAVYAILNKSENLMKDLADYAKYANANPDSMSAKELLQVSFMSKPEYKYMSEEDKLAEFETYFEENFSDLDADPGARRRYNAAIAEAKATIGDKKAYLNGLVESFSQSGEPEDESDNANPNKTQVSEEDQRKFQKYQDEADNLLDDFGGLSLQVGDKPDDIVEFPHQDTDVDGFESVKEMVRNPIAGYRDYFMDAYVDPKTHEIDSQRLLQDTYIMKNWQAISKEIYKTGINAGREQLVKERNNTDGNGARALRSQSAQLGDEDGFFEAAMKAKTVTY